MQVRSARRCYDRCGAARWNLTFETFRGALERSAAHHFGDRATSPADVDRYVGALHLDELALACACAEGSEPAWDHFVREFRPVLYRAADAIDPAGGARDLADALYADLFGLREQGSGRNSLFRYYHGRSRLATWLRAVLAQRHVDRLRATRRLEPLPEADSETPGRHRPELASPPAAPAGERTRFLETVQPALAAALAALAPRDRLRLTLYYVRQMTLAAIGRLLREHEGTVSRHLTRTRAAIRQDVENRLRTAGLTPTEISEGFAAVMADAGPIDLASMLDPEAAGAPPEAVMASRKDPDLDRSR